MEKRAQYRSLGGLLLKYLELCFLTQYHLATSGDIFSCLTWLGEEEGVLPVTSV